MADPIVISVTSEVTGAVKGVDDVNAQLQKTSAALAGVSKDGKVNVEELTTQLGQYTTQVKQKTTEQTEAFGVSNREINAAQKETLRTGAAGVASLVSQSVNGIDGTVQGALGALSNISTGVAALSSIPEVGAIAGVVALITAAVSGAFQKSEADTKALEASVASMTAQLEKVGIAGVDSFSAVNAQLDKFAATTDGSKDDLTVIAANAKEAGVNVDEYARALAGSTKDQEALYDSVKRQTVALEKQAQSYDQTDASQRENYGTVLKQLDGLEKVSKALKDQNDTLGESADRIKVSTSAKESENVQTQKQIDLSHTLAAVESDTSSIAATLATEQQNYDSAAQTSSEKLKRTVTATNAYTVASILQAQQDELTALTNSKSDEIKIYETFGKEAGDKIIAGAKGQPSLLAAYSQFSPAEAAQYINTAKAQGALQGESASKAAQAALRANPLTSNVTLTTPDAAALVKGLQKQVDNTPAIKVQIQGIAAGKRVI